MPIWLAIYWRVSPGATGQLELRAGDGWSLVTAETTSDTWEWSRVPGWLEVGLGPHASLVSRLYLRTTSPAGVLYVRDVLVCAR